MLTVRVYDNYDLIALQDLDTDDFEGCKFSKKFRAESRYGKTNVMCRTLKSFKLLENSTRVRDMFWPCNNMSWLQALLRYQNHGSRAARKNRTPVFEKTAASPALLNLTYLLAYAEFFLLQSKIRIQYFTHIFYWNFCFNLETVHLLSHQKIPLDPPPFWPILFRNFWHSKKNWTIFVKKSACLFPIEIKKVKLRIVQREERSSRFLLKAFSNFS